LCVPELRKVVVCGVGLIGGSFALALRKAGAVGEIVGVGRSKASLQAALALGVIDAAACDLRAALAGADLVLLATPVGQFEPLMVALAPHLEPGTLVTDGGSTKGDVVAAARRAFGTRIAQFVPSHPIAGAEKSGVAAASAELYQGRRVVMTPLPENSEQTVERVRRAWATCGASVSRMTPEAHDLVFAAVSHLPHLLAYALVDDLARRDNAPLLFGYAASGFRDFTRIAGSHPEMWRDICIANRTALLAELDAYLAQLGEIRALLDSADAAALEAVFERARQARNTWAEGGIVGSVSGE
jgi:prephenate dehydrogenase